MWQLMKVRIHIFICNKEIDPKSPPSTICERDHVILEKAKGVKAIIWFKQAFFGTSFSSKIQRRTVPLVSLRTNSEDDFKLLAVVETVIENGINTFVGAFPYKKFANISIIGFCSKLLFKLAQFKCEKIKAAEMII